MELAPAPADTDADTDEPAVPRSIGRVLDLLEIVLAEGSITLTSAATAAGLTPTTALRHLRALEARGYVERDAAGLFSAGPTLTRIAGELTRTSALELLVAAAQPILDQLAATTGESAYLAVADGAEVTYVATAESPRAIRHVGWVGQRVPRHGTAVGQALDEPGATATRTGAVEEDITAVARAVAPGRPGRAQPASGRRGSDQPGPVPPGAVHRDSEPAVGGVALSVIGPRHRMDRTACRGIAASLADATATLLARIPSGWTEAGAGPLDHSPVSPRRSPSGSSTPNDSQRTRA